MFGYRGNQGIVELVNKILRREVVRYEDVDEEGWMGERRKGEVLGFAGYRSKYEDKEEVEEVEKEGNVVLEGVSQFIAVDDNNDDDGSKDDSDGNRNVNVSKGECKCRCRCKCNQYQYQTHQPPQQFQQHDKHPPPQHDTMINEVRKSVVSNHKPKLGVQNMSHSHSNIISMNFNQIHNKHNKQSKTTLKRGSCAPFFHFGDKQQQQRVVVPQPEHTSNTNLLPKQQIPMAQPASTSLQQRQWFNLQNIKSSSVILPKRVSKSKAFQMYYCIDKAYTPELKAKYPKHPVMSKVSRNHITTSSNNNNVVAAGSNTTSNNNNNVLTADKLMCEVSNIESSNIHSSTSSSFILEQSKESEREQQREEKQNVERYYYKVGSHYHDKELMMVVNNTRLARGRGDDEREKVMRRYASKERSYSSEESHRKRKKVKKYKEKGGRKISIPKRKKQQQQPCIDLVSEDLMKQYSNIITSY